MNKRPFLLVVSCVVLVCAYARQYMFQGSLEAPEDTPVTSRPTEPTAAKRPPDALPPAANDSGTTLDTLRQRQLEHINSSRNAHGLSSVYLDETASRAAQAHCEAMARDDFFGHAGLNGSRPFHRYNLDEGGDGHVAENVCLYKSSTAFAADETAIAELAKKGHGLFMAEVPPADGHRRNILDKRHNYVGIGVSVNGGNYTYCEEFLDKYMEISTLSPKIIPNEGRITFTGRVINPARFGLYLLVATYDAQLIPPANPKSQPSSYRDSGAEKAALVPPWDFNKDGSRFDMASGEFTISLKVGKPGYYYIVFYLKEDPQSIPYQARRASVSTNDGFIGGAQVIKVI